MSISGHHKRTQWHPGWEGFSFTSCQDFSTWKDLIMRKTDTGISLLISFIHFLLQAFPCLSHYNIARSASSGSIRYPCMSVLLLHFYTHHFNMTERCETYYSFTTEDNYYQTPENEMAGINIAYELSHTNSSKRQVLTVF